MSDIIMIRHARTEANALGLLQGQSDSPVLADLLASHPTWRDRGLPAPDAVYCSPQRRARVTAAHLLPTTPLVIDDRLAERHLGVLDGLAAEQLFSERPDLAEQMANDPTYTPAGGESADQVSARVRDFVADVAAQGDAFVGCVTHGALMAITLRLLVGVAGRPHIDNLQAVHLRVGSLDATHPVELVGALPRPVAAVSR